MHKARFNIGTIFSTQGEVCDERLCADEMEKFSKEIRVGNITLELAIHESNGQRRVVITAKDDKNRRLWRTPIMDNGTEKIYNSEKDAIDDAEKKLKIYLTE